MAEKVASSPLHPRSKLMLELTEKSKKQLLSWKLGEGIVFVRARNNKIIRLNAHLGENGKLYIGEHELVFDVNKIKEEK